ncbi:MAG: carboxylating nicotinate-nucleotide diphosphorylase [Nitrospirae bacterium]|nr:MAG: carboxylating nicotinate-nucleotide diphosphorylase [Nitrospirota bacterium]
MDFLNNPLLREVIRIALLEDLGSGDITTRSIISAGSNSNARIIAKEPFVFAGMPFVHEVFRMLGGVEIKGIASEGAVVKGGDIMAQLSGRTATLLEGERVALNILQRVSGIATKTREFVDKVAGLDVSISDTRKTAPGLRLLDKYGVSIGGGKNHRFGLYDGVLIKDNHIAAAGGVKKAVELARKAHHLLKIEVEVSDFDELDEALAAGADVIMLDNMTIEDMKKAVGITNKRALLEASGNVGLENVRAIAETGVDIISIGALTHSVKAADISMKIG